MFSVAVVDDEAEERARIRKCLDYVARERNVEFHVEEFSTTESFLMSYDPRFDLVFMDILFGTGRSGMDAAHSLRQLDSSVPLVFVTNMAQMAMENRVLSFTDNLPDSTKTEEPGFHGYGLRSVRAIAKKYGGDVSVAVTDDLFNVNVYLMADEKAGNG